MPTKKKTDTTTTPFDTSALDALDPAVLADRQRIVDLAVRKARNGGYCEVVESFLADIMPEFGVQSTNRYGEPFVRFYASDGVDCRGESLVPGVRVYNKDGYDQKGYDRDGFAQSYHRETSALRPGRPATEEETAAEAAALAAVVNPTTYVKPTA